MCEKAETTCGGLPEQRLYPLFLHMRRIIDAVPLLLDQCGEVSEEELCKLRTQSSSAVTQKEALK